MKKPRQTPFESHSQAGQDRFVYELMIRNNPGYRGTFLDIGASDDSPGKSNTLALEKLGWWGVLIDRNPMKSDRQSLSITDDFRNFRLDRWRCNFDYLSLDVDDNQMKALLAVSVMRFSVLTVEHDKYHIGESLQDSEFCFLFERGYERICKDVCCDGLPFEDWWVDPLKVDMDIANRFRCEGKDYKEIFNNAN